MYLILNVDHWKYLNNLRTGSFVFCPPSCGRGGRVSNTFPTNIAEDSENSGITDIDAKLKIKRRKTARQQGKQTDTTRWSSVDKEEDS